MSGADDLSVDVDVVDVPPPPAGTPPDFRERVALALKTTDETVLRDAELAYRGTFASAHEYIAQQVAAQLPDDMRWLAAHCNPDVLRGHYEGGRLIVWEVRLRDVVMVFESERQHLSKTALMKRWNMRQSRPEVPSDTCPSCQTKDPDTLHVVRINGDFCAVGCNNCLSR